MAAYETFAKIPLKVRYSYYYERIERKSNELIKSDNTRTAIDASEGVLEWLYEDLLAENGMERLALIIAAFLYQMSHNEIDPLMACAVNWHIEDFEKGDYESLFKDDDLKHIKSDIAIIKDYLSEHPEVLKD